MSLLQEKILAILAPLQLTSLATITAEGAPWVRYVMTTGSPDLTIRCATFAQARKVAQIAAQAEVHLTMGVTSPAAMKPYLQIQGRARFSREAHERHAFWNGMLSTYFSGPDDPNYGVVIVTPYRIELCTTGPAMPEVWTAG